MKIFIIFLLFFGSLSARSVYSGELHGPHTHGEMELLILWDGHKLQLTLVASAEDLIGYERDPQTAKEKKALRKFDAKYDPFEIFKINASAACEYIQGRSASDMFSASPHKHGFLDKTHMHELGLKEHIDFLMHHVYECKTTPEITLDLFTKVPSITKINIRNGVIDGDIKSTLTKDNNIYLVE